MKIRDIDLGEKPLFLAPMEDVTDPSFRLMCKRFGADMVYTEFVSSDALIRSISRTQQKLTIYEEERPVAIQIYGKEMDAMVEAAKICEAAGPDIIDLNFGCPVKKVAAKGAGSGMLREPDKLVEIVSEIVKAVKIPVTVKTRLGWDDSSKIIVELAERIQSRYPSLSRPVWDGMTLPKSLSNSLKEYRMQVPRHSPFMDAPALRCTPVMRTGHLSVR